jgi:hypothetical protein
VLCTSHSVLFTFTPAPVGDGAWYEGERVGTLPSDQAELVCGRPYANTPALPQVPPHRVVAALDNAHLLVNVALGGSCDGVNVSAVMVMKPGLRLDHLDVVLVSLARRASATRRMSTVNSRTFDFLKMRRAALLTAALGYCRRTWRSRSAEGRP